MNTSKEEVTGGRTVARVNPPCPNVAKLVADSEQARIAAFDKANPVPGEREPESRGKDVYQIVTDRIIEKLEAGVVPWHKPWASDSRFPINLVSGKAYRGINVWLLHTCGYASPYWVSYKQAKDLGGQVRKGEKSSLAVFWKRLEVEDQAQENGKRFVPMLRYYNIFNVEQCDGVEYEKPEARNPDFNPIDEACQIVVKMPNPPKLTFNEARAYYSRRDDIVNMPKPESFDGEQEYYSTLFHELTHSTGHETRLARLQDDNSAFGSSKYAKEELIAEMGAAYLSAQAGILHRTLDNSAAYIGCWLDRLKNDRKLVVQAASAAHRASDYILGVKYEDKPKAKQVGRVNVMALVESEAV